MAKFKTHKSGFVAVLALLAVAIIFTYAYARNETNPVTYTDHQRFRSKVTFDGTGPTQKSEITIGTNTETTTSSGATTTFNNVPYFAAGFKRDVIIINGLEDLSAWTTSGASYFQTVVGKTYLVSPTSIATKQNAKNQWGSATTGITTFSAVTAVLPFCNDPWDNDQQVTIIHSDSSTTPVQIWAGVPSGTTEYNKDAYASQAQNLEVTWSTTTITSGISDWSLNGLQEFATYTLYCSNVATDPMAGVSAYKTNAKYIAW